VSTPVDAVVADVRDTAEWLRARGATRVGAVGFCWGAWAFAHASAAGVPLACGVGAHPSFKNESNCGFGSDEALAARTAMPVLLLAAGDDPANVQLDGAVTAALAARGGRTVAFPGMAHGWVTRGDLGDSEVAAEVERALTETLAFLCEHV
jgi:dienelactone hydrolase